MPSPAPTGPALPGAAAHLACASADTPALLVGDLRRLADALPAALALPGATPEPLPAAAPAAIAAAARRLNAQPRRPLRIAFVAADLAALQRLMRQAADRLEADPALRGAVSRDTLLAEAGDAPAAFLCPGQGSQRVGLLAGWRALPAFEAALAQAEADVADLLPRPLTAYLYAEDATEDALTDTAVAQPAMLAVGLGVAAVLRQFGAQPAILLGHSLGEFTAAALSGAVSPRDAIRFVARRGTAMRALPGDHGAMAAIMASREEILDGLAALPEGPRARVVLANYNHPAQSVLSGPTPDVEAAITHFQARHIKARAIPVSHAFHAPLLAPIQPAVDAAVAELQAAGAFHPPAIPLASCVGPAPRTADDVAAIFSRHATSPVDYVAGIGQCREAGARIFLQLCSGTTLTAFAKGSAPDATAVLPVSDEKQGSPETFVALLRLLGWLTVCGHPIDLSGLSGG